MIHGTYCLLWWYKEGIAEEKEETNSPQAQPQIHTRAEPFHVHTQTLLTNHHRSATALFMLTGTIIDIVFLIRSTPTRHRVDILIGAHNLIRQRQ